MKLISASLLLLLSLYLTAAEKNTSVAESAHYQPQPGDIIFQSLPHSDLTDAIEGATNSKFSHVGMVIEKDNTWFVREAIGDVHDTPLNEFTSRGRDRKFEVYRLRETHQKYIPNFIEASKAYLNRPYDIRYRFDDETIYCSELIYKAFKQAANIELGRLVKLGELDWGKYEQLIQQLEGGPVPKNRKMITPRDLAQAKQLNLIYSSY